MSWAQDVDPQTAVAFAYVMAATGGALVGFAAGYGWCVL